MAELWAEGCEPLKGPLRRCGFGAGDTSTATPQTGAGVEEWAFHHSGWPLPALEEPKGRGLADGPSGIINRFICSICSRLLATRAMWDMKSPPKQAPQYGYVKSRGPKTYKPWQAEESITMYCDVVIAVDAYNRSLELPGWLCAFKIWLHRGPSLGTLVLWEKTPGP